MRDFYRSFSRVVDDVVLSWCVVTERHRGFSRGNKGAPPSLADLLAEADAAPPGLAWEPDGVARRVPVALPGLRTATYFDYAPGPGDADTLVVYHHGLGEVTHDLVPSLVLAAPGLRGRCDRIALKGLHHEDFLAVSDRLTADRDHFMRCIVASASVAGAVARLARGRYRHLVLCGVSLGGVVTLVEALRGPRFDLYVPFVAGPALPDVLLRSAFSRIVAGASLRRERAAPWRDAFDITDLLASSEGPPIHPLLARSDRLFRHDVHVAAYARVKRARVASFEGGHITGAANVVALAGHLRRALAETCWRVPSSGGAEAGTPSPPLDAGRAHARALAGVP